jgi:hypothetical protein
VEGVLGDWHSYSDIKSRPCEIPLHTPRMASDA